VTRLVTKLGTAGDIAIFTAIFTTNITAIFTAIICCIAWVQSPFMMEAKKVLCLAGRQSQARECSYNRELAKNI